MLANWPLQRLLAIPFVDLINQKFLQYAILCGIRLTWGDAYGRIISAIWIPFLRDDLSVPILVSARKMRRYPLNYFAAPESASVWLTFRKFRVPTGSVAFPAPSDKKFF